MLIGDFHEKGTIEGIGKSHPAIFSFDRSHVDEFIVMYQETKSLPKEAMQYVLWKELEMVSLFEKIFTSA